MASAQSQLSEAGAKGPSSKAPQSPKVPCNQHLRTASLVRGRSPDAFLDVERVDLGRDNVEVLL